MRSIVALVAAMALLMALAGPAHAGAPVRLPPGWSLAPTAAGLTLRYELQAPLPLRDARPEFRDGTRVLGYPVQREDALYLEVPNAATQDLRDPSVWLGVRRIDGPTPDQHFDIAPQPAPAPGDASGIPVLPARDDPGRRGPYGIQRHSYDLEAVPFPRYPVPLEVSGDVIAPVGAPGARPLVLFLHGRHGTCYQASGDQGVSGDWPCPDGWKAIPSYRGYRYIAGLLASQGYVTVSISANAINSQDFGSADGGAAARSKLIRHHLRLWSKWSRDGGDPWGGVFKGKVDMQNVVLVGHSRGGEGVERAAVDIRPSAPYRISGLVAIGPTTFGRQVGLGIPQEVILPYCDGDVSDLQGQQILENSRDLGTDSAVRSSALVLGANHNYFNTEWTPGIAEAPAEDDWNFSGSPSDPTCGATAQSRLKPEAQQLVGATYVAALVHVAAEKDEKALPLLDGTGVRAMSAGRATVRAHALGGNRTSIIRPALNTRIESSGVLAKPCHGSLQSDDGSISECAVTFNMARLPHWLSMYFAEGAPSEVALDLSWKGIGGSARIALDRPVSVAAGESLELRVAVDPKVGPARFSARLVDASGKVATIPGEAHLSPLPGDVAPLGKVWASTVRFDLAHVHGVDLTAIAAVEIVPTQSGGHIWLLDGSTWAPGLAPSRWQVLPQVSIGDLSVRETDGPQQIELPLTVSGRITEPVDLWVQVVDFFDARKSRGRLVTLEPGKSHYALPFVVPGNTTFSGTRNVMMATVKAVSNVTTGRYQASIRLIEDDAPPRVKLSVVDKTVAEGESIVFRVSLDRPASDYFFYRIDLAQFGSRPQLFTDDVPVEWLQQYLPEVPNPPVPLGSVIQLYVSIQPGATSTEISVPIAADGVPEGTEGILGIIRGGESPTVPKDLRAGVLVTDAP